MLSLERWHCMLSPEEESRAEGHFLIDKRDYHPSWSNDGVSTRAALSDPPTKPMFYAEWRGAKVHTVYQIISVHKNALPGAKTGWMTTQRRKSWKPRELSQEQSDQGLPGRRKHESMVVIEHWDGVNQNPNPSQKIRRHYRIEEKKGFRETCKDPEPKLVAEATAQVKRKRKRGRLQKGGDEITPAQETSKEKLEGEEDEQKASKKVFPGPSSMPGNGE